MIEVSPTVIAITSTLIVTLLGIIGYFVKIQNETLNKLNTIVIRLESVESIKSQQCNTYHMILDKRLEAFANDIKNHEMRILKLENS